MNKHKFNDRIDLPVTNSPLPKNPLIKMQRNMNKPTIRPDWDTYFLAIAKEVSARATCPRASVGAVLVSPNHRILSTGYNGAEPGSAQCDEVGCDVVDNHCQRAIHGEANSIGHAARYGIPVEGATMYVYDSGNRPDCCRECWKIMKAAGIVRAVLNNLTS